jgi:hypothetical protein
VSESNTRVADDTASDEIYSDGYAVHMRLEPGLAKRIHKFHTIYSQELDRLGANCTMTQSVRRLLCLALDNQGL